MVEKRTLSLVLLSALGAIALSGQTRLLMDLAELQLEISSSEVVKDIVGSNMSPAASLRARDGFKLVVVTLKGSAPSSCPCVISMQSSEFTAIFEPKAGSRMQTAGAMSGPVNDYWQIAPERGGSVENHALVDPGPVVFRVAFAVPIEVDAFLVRYPTLARGKASASRPKPPGGGR